LDKVKQKLQTEQSLYDESVESLQQEIKGLEDENKEILDQIQMVSQITKAYFGEQELKMLEQGLVYLSYQDQFKFDS
jgi:hypothetical protein